MDKVPVSYVSIWRAGALRAWDETKSALLISRASLVIAFLLFLIYLVLVWQLGDPEMVREEVIKRVSESFAPILFIPLLWLWKFPSSVDSIHRNTVVALDEANEFIVGSYKIEMAIVQNDNEILFRMENLGPQLWVEVSLDY